MSYTSNVSFHYSRASGLRQVRLSIVSIDPAAVGRRNHYLCLFAMGVDRNMIIKRTCEYEPDAILHTAAPVRTIRICL
jgi:hypothetical protein